MPELPEVETVVRTLAPHLPGRRIEDAHFHSRLVTRGGAAKTARALRGRTIRALRRRGKQIFFDLDRGTIYVHLGMTGKLLWNGAPGKHTHAVLQLDEGTLVYDDPRQFGRFEYYETLPSAFDDAGPDALDISFEDFYERLKRRKGQLKPMLLNQSFLAGVGNIYADETLFAARLHPRAVVGRLSKKRALELHRSLIAVLEEAVRHRGSSISDYVDGAGERGSFQQFHAVYGREGQPCLRCGTLIRRIVIGQRSTHYCPRCQRA